MGQNDFDQLFKELTGHPPFPWQQELFARFVAGEFPQQCDLPTGLGKTSVIPIWLISLASAPENVPRRLVYVVNRRTVVDQASDEVIKMRKKLESLPDLRHCLASLCAADCNESLAISTLRGQFADNGEWSADPARPAVIVGTVDMIGSRLLFNGYGQGYRHRPLHAGFLAQDTLLIHDEAHLEPAFQKLLDAIQKEQKKARDCRAFKVIELSATSRGGVQPFSLTDADRQNAVVAKRINAAKQLALHPVDDEKNVADAIAGLALTHKDSGQAILIFVRRLDDFKRVADKLKGHVVQMLTGTLRGKERDDLAKKDTIFARFLPEPLVEPRPGTVYLLCTSAGEVGVNISADHLVCDLTTFESVAQRFGRVNRFGNRPDTRIDIVHPKALDEKSPFDVRRKNTLELLTKLNGSASPHALGKLDPQARREAFSPDPIFLYTSDILFDAWALTTIQDDLPGRPPVADFLHGMPTDWQPPQTQVAWRREVEWISTDELIAEYAPTDLLADYPVKPHELLRDSSSRVFKELAKLNEKSPNASVWLVKDAGKVLVRPLAEIIGDGDYAIENVMILLPPSVGGLEKGMLRGDAGFDPIQADYDVADEWFDISTSEDDKRTENQRRLRLRVDTASRSADPSDTMRFIRSLILQPVDEESPSEDEPKPERAIEWWVRSFAADDDGSKFARFDQHLGDHHHRAEDVAKAFAKKLDLGETEATAIGLAAKWHDLGKDRPVWQQSIGNEGYRSDPKIVLAKSEKHMRWRDLNCYRHEFGTLLDLCGDRHGCAKELARQPEEVRELVMHLIAAHHGRARPHFPPREMIDAAYPTLAAQKLAREIPERFARLQRKYGRWGLAWLESLVRAADILASQNEKGDAK